MKKPRATKPGAGKSHAAKSAAHPPAKNDPAPLQEGLIVSHLLIVRDVARSRQFYADVLGAQVVLEGPPSLLRFHNSWLVLSAEAGPTNTRPGISARAPNNESAFASALNLRVPNIQDVYERWRDRGAAFLTPPVEHDSEIRCYLRDPDGHLIQLGQATQRVRRPMTA